MPGFFGWIVIGVFAGWIASLMMNRHHGLIVNLIIGLVGAVLGGWIASLLHFYTLGWVSAFVVAFGGSVLLLFVIGLIRRPKSS